MWRQIPEVVIQRLPTYARALAILEQEGVEVVSSRDLGAQLRITPAQIRKDLSYFGRFGRQGRGYGVRGLLGQLRQILGLDREWPMILVGVGRLGRAIMDYRGFAEEGFRIVAAFDKDPKEVGKRVGRIRVQGLEELEEVIKGQRIDIGIVAVPPGEAQAVIDDMIRCGVGAILNYAPATAHVPSSVQLRSVDPVLALQSMTFHLKSRAPGATGGRRARAQSGD